MQLTITTERAVSTGFSHLHFGKQAAYAHV